MLGDSLATHPGEHSRDDEQGRQHPNLCRIEGANRVMSHDLSPQFFLQVLFLQVNSKGYYRFASHITREKGSFTSHITRKIRHTLHVENFTLSTKRHTLHVGVCIPMAVSAR